MYLLLYTYPILYFLFNFLHLISIIFLVIKNGEDNLRFKGGMVWLENHPLDGQKGNYRLRLLHFSN